MATGYENKKGLWIDPELKDRLMALGEANGQSANFLGNQIIRLVLEQHPEVLRLAQGRIAAANYDGVAPL